MLYASSGFIRSPNYPRPYRNRAVCEWIITVAVGNTITLNVTDLNIETSTSCRYDHVEVRDGANSSAAFVTRLCGSTRPTSMIKSTKNVLYVRFRSDASISGRGFEFRYTSGRQVITEESMGIYKLN